MLSPEAIIGLAALLVTFPTTFWCLWKWYSTHKTRPRDDTSASSWIALADYEESALGVQRTGSTSINRWPNNNEYRHVLGPSQLGYLDYRPGVPVLQFGSRTTVSSWAVMHGS
ncbi:hypothetical protein QBC39DRAFT_351272 [Podospora conica]|nr:hypothetical protein QBC39DRAFT_351272 [Schizothecium conicum]